MNTNKNTTPILYSFRRCPFEIRARSALYFSNIKVILREVVLKNKPKEMLDVSNKATVPVLVLKEKVIDESLDIVIWALKTDDKLNLLNPYHKEKDKIIKFINQIDNQFKYHLDRYKYSSRYEGCKSFEGKNKHRDHAANYIIEIESLLKKNKATYLYDNKLSIVDLCIFPLIRQYRIADKKWFDDNTSFIRTIKWLTTILELDFFKIIMKKYKPWRAASIPQFFASNL